MEKRESFLRALPEEFVSERNVWSFHNGEAWLCWLMLSAVTSYIEMITWPLDVRWQCMWGNGGIPAEAGGRRG